MIENVKCYNCGACLNICPQNAVTIAEGSLFYYPAVAESCVHCGLCESVCPAVRKFDPKRPVSAWAGWHRNPDIVRKSSSGGAFYALAENVISDGGVVFGAAYSEDCRKVRFCSSDSVGLEPLLKSKYVESLTGNAFSEVRKALDSGRRVMFCGTPCQAAGLRLFLSKEYENLLLCDFVCGGVASHRLYERYLCELEKKYRAKIVSMDFRPKTYGWRRYAVKAVFSNGRIYNRLGAEDPYLRSFLHGKLTVRERCFDCTFSDRSQADITLSDFWLYQKLSDLRNDDGISLMICNTEKGNSEAEKLEDVFLLHELDVDKASYNITPMRVTEDELNFRHAFLTAAEKSELRTVCDEYIPTSIKKRVKNTAVRLLRGRKKERE